MKNVYLLLKYWRYFHPTIYNLSHNSGAQKKLCISFESLLINIYYSTVGENIFLQVISVSCPAIHHICLISFRLQELWRVCICITPLVYLFFQIMR